MTAMRLAELNAEFLGAGGEGIFRADGSPAPQRDGVGVMLDCPCQSCGERLYVPFANPIDGGESVEPRGWERTGDTIETLTLRPSIWRHPDKGGCGWHGWVTNGEVTGA